MVQGLQNYIMFLPLYNSITQELHKEIILICVPLKENVVFSARDVQSDATAEAGHARHRQRIRKL